MHAQNKVITEKIPIIIIIIIIIRNYMQFFLNWVLLTLLYMLFDKCLVYIYVSFKVLVCIRC
jgi:hypothetical protein